MYPLLSLLYLRRLTVKGHLRRENSISASFGLVYSYRGGWK